MRRNKRAARKSTDQQKVQTGDLDKGKNRAGAGSNPGSMGTGATSPLTAKKDKRREVQLSQQSSGDSNGRHMGQSRPICKTIAIRRSIGEI
jgi:hypothetical protein